MKLSVAVVLSMFPLITLADITGLEVQGTTISWTDTGYIQVQDTINFDTVNNCEGNISSCTVEPGKYNVINHSANRRQNNIVVTASEAPITPPVAITPPVTATPPPSTVAQQLVFTRMARTCEYYSGSPDTNLGPFFDQRCAVECPINEIAIGGGCSGQDVSLAPQTSALARQYIPRYNIVGELGSSSYSCNFTNTRISDREAANQNPRNNTEIETRITAQVMCLSQ